MVTVNVLEELFVPGSQHTHEERERLEHARQEAGDHGMGTGPIDLDSGRVVVPVPRPDPASGPGGGD